jgi:hypothetical protein
VIACSWCARVAGLCDLGGPADLLDDEEASVAVHHALNFGNLVAAQDEEAGAAGTYRLVFAGADLERFRAGRVAALADEQVDAGLADQLGQLRDPLVHLTKHDLVTGGLVDCTTSAVVPPDVLDCLICLLRHS